jgi:hypothetical protein
MCLGALVDVNEVTKQASLRDRFPGSRFHEHLPPQARRQLKEVGWAKGVELAKLARRDKQHFDCATWLHRAREMPKEQFKPPRQFLLDLLGTVGASKKQSATSRNSLLTVKNTGDFYFPGPNNDAPYLDITLIRIDLLSGDVEKQTGSFQREIRESNSLIRSEQHSPRTFIGRKRLTNLTNTPVRATVSVLK